MCECGDNIKSQMALNGCELTVTNLEPIVPLHDPDLEFVCSHGVTWYAEPTAEELIRWRTYAFRQGQPSLVCRRCWQKFWTEYEYQGHTCEAQP